jgi:hypothetical protein
MYVVEETERSKQPGAARFPPQLFDSAREEKEKET